MDLNINNHQRAEILTQALPYIQKYHDKIIVVKYGGNAMISEDLKMQVMEDIVLLWLIGVKPVLVHGGGPEISEMLKKVGKESVFVDGLRVTDKETAEIVQMVLAGKINKNLVNLLGEYGGNAVGISGIDGHLIEAKVKDERLGFVGEITKVNVQPIFDLIEKGYIPVVSTVGCDNEGNVYNINADTAASFIAGAILRDVNDPDSIIKRVNTEEARQLFREGVISGGMIPKVECCIEAIEKGVRRVTILDGRVPHAVLLELLTDEGAGTLVKGME